jgi:Cys-tRNA(Pro)/Cys-tRNA(Cys) deacylase
VPRARPRARPFARPRAGSRAYSGPVTDTGEYPTDGERRALAALESSAVPFRITRHGPVRSLAEAAEARGVAPANILKTLVVRRGDEDYLFVLVPGDRAISWPKLRALLGVSRLSMPDPGTARAVTGYERGTITPFGSLRDWPVVADSRVRGKTISIGAGAHGVAATLEGDDVVRALGATVSDVTEAAEG